MENPEVVVTPNPQIIEPTPPVVKTGIKTSHVLLVLLGFLLVGGLCFALGLYYSNLSKNVANTTANSDQLEDQPMNEEVEVKTTKYLYQTKEGALVQGDLATNSEKVLVNGLGNFGSLQEVKVSPDGKYITFLRLPEEVVAGYQKTPPYEFHGGSYNLYIVDTSKPLDTKLVAKEINYGYGSNFGIMFQGNSFSYSYPVYDTNLAKDIIKTYSYDIASNLNKVVESNDYFTYIYSPSKKNYVTVVTGTSITPLNYNSSLNLYEASGKFIKTLYQYVDSPNDYSGNVVFASEDKIYLAREVYSDGPNSICYIDEVDIKSGKTTEIEKKNCPPGSSQTNYHNLKVSPDGKYLSALYAEDPFIAEGQYERNYKGSMFVYDINSKAKRTIAESNYWYSNYWWVSNTEAFLFGGTNPDDSKVKKVNMVTGEVSEVASLANKSIIAIY